MLAICKKELKLAFSGIFGYAVLAIQLFSLGLCFLLFNLLPASADLSYTFVAMQGVLLVLVPLLSARAATRGQRNHADAVQRALPLSPVARLLGTYLALLVQLLIPAAVAALFPLWLYVIGGVSLATAYTAWLGYLLLICALAAICLFASSHARRPIVSYLLALATLLLLGVCDWVGYLLPTAPWLSFLLCLAAALGAAAWSYRLCKRLSLALALGGGLTLALTLWFVLIPDAFSALVPRFLEAVAVFARFGDLAHGYLDLSAVLLFLTLTALSLFLTLRLEKSRSVTASAAPRMKPVATLVTASVLLLAVLGNACFGLLPYRTRHLAVTPSDPFSAKGASLDLLAELDEEITLYLVCDGNAADGEIYRFLLSYAAHSPRIHVQTVSPKLTPHFPAEHGLADWPEVNSILVESEKRSRLIDYTDLFFYYCYDSYYGYGMTMTPAEYQSMLQSFSEESASALAEFIGSTTAYFDGETAMANALRYVTREEVLTLCVLRGGTGASAPDATLTKELTAAGCDLYTLLSATEIPEGCDVLLLHAPTSDLSEQEAEALSSYLASGGKLFLTTHYEYRELPRLRAILASYGMQMSEARDVVLEGDPDYMTVDATGTYPELFRPHIRSAHAATGDFDGSFLFYLAHAIDLTETAGVTLTPWLYTSRDAVRTYYDAVKKDWVIPETTASYPVGVIAEAGDTAILWLASPYPLRAEYNTSSGGGNFTLLLNALGALGNTDTSRTSLAPSAIDAARLSEVSPPSLLLAGACFVLLLPLGTASVGGAVLAARKRRK
ncbi:MAG: Gldg family protein [Clostridia bacterium]|nr:Gldg family protein [Clostridia bacterium]